MANPQPDKFTRISSELLEAICKIEMPDQARRLFLFIIRKTYGYNKKDGFISTKQIILGTNMGRRQVERARAILRQMNLISTATQDGTLNLMYSIQKDYDAWLPYKVPTRASVPTRVAQSTDTDGTKVPTPKGVPYMFIDNRHNKQQNLKSAETTETQKPFQFQPPESDIQALTGKTHKEILKAAEKPLIRNLRPYKEPMNPQTKKMLLHQQAEQLKKDLKP